MAVISLNMQSKFLIPGLGLTSAQCMAMINVAVRSALSRGTDPPCFALLANLVFVGARNPDILFTSQPDRRTVWATARIKGWGRGIINFNSWTGITKYWKSYFPTVDALQTQFTELMEHEGTHILCYTTAEHGNLPLAPDLLARLVGHWGPPRAMARGKAQPVELDLLTGAEPERKLKELTHDFWIDR